MARPERFELPTPWFVARYSIQLSYGRADLKPYAEVVRRPLPYRGRASYHTAESLLDNPLEASA